ncbi:MAG TPA: hypothetical protein DCM02_08595, partial [Flavobacterium sp.]|nr:hypothetical protein [Flavobacterium sp.]
QGDKGDKAVNWKGAYNNSTNYIIDDAVSYNGSSYICKLATTGNLPTNSTYWDLLAQKGTDGVGAGDMVKLVYDTNNNGVVDNSEKLNGQSASFYAPETTTTIGTLINSATAKNTPIDADQVGLMDSVASNIFKKLSWANIKATLKTYFDTLYTTNGGAILQVNSVTKTDIQTISTYNTWIDIIGLSVSITPSSISSKILIMFSVNGSVTYDASLRIVRDSTPVGVGDAAGAKMRCTTEFPCYMNTAGAMVVSSITYLDTPATISAITYKIQAYATSQPAYVNRSATDIEGTHNSRGISTVTLMEIAG